jgi:hypothetical protein
MKQYNFRQHLSLSKLMKNIPAKTRQIRAGMSVTLNNSNNHLQTDL